MSRVVNPNSPARSRDHARRTIAEMLRHLMHKRSLDDETRDMAATIVFSLKDIADAIDITTQAWEKRDYFLKADRYRLEWEWVTPAAQRLAELIRADRWSHLAVELASLAPRFADVRILKMTRSPAAWHGRYRALVDRA